MQNRTTLFLASCLMLLALLSCKEPRKTYSAGINSFVPVRDFTENILKQKQTLWKISSANDGFALPETSFQKIMETKTADSKTTVAVLCGDAASSDAEVVRSADTDDTMLLTINSAEIQGLLQKAGATPREIERFVFDYIVNKTEGIPMLPARNIVQGKTGDCTEHAVLAAAILRARGIPARGVIGMILGEDGDFCFHMWNEVLWQGKPMLIDATRPDGVYPNRYIAFAYHNLKTEMPLACFKAMAAIQNIDAEYITGD